MLTVLACLTYDHDAKLVLLAAAICISGSWISMRLFARAQGDRSNSVSWLFLAGVASGSSVWATHFVAMLAFQPGTGFGYDAVITMSSLAVAIVTCTAGMSLGLSMRHAVMPLLGGGLFGLGVAAMHYLGMRAIDSSGSLMWTPELVVTSLIIGPAFGAVALYLATHARTRLMFAAAVGSMVWAICGLHFFGMAAVTIIPNPAADAPALLLQSDVIAAAVALVTFLVIGTGFATHLIDARTILAADRRFLDLADAALEGLVVVDDGKIVGANGSFEALSGYSRFNLLGRALFPDLIRSVEIERQSEVRAKHMLSSMNGVNIPIELLTSLAADGKAIYAVRDLREKIASEQRIHYLAHFDMLTNLPNRPAFVSHLELALRHAEAEGQDVAVLGMDLDRFKEVNDIFGHGVGDEVLRRFAERVSQRLQEGEYLARLGGDEFVAVQIGVSQPEGACGLSDRIIAAAIEPAVIDDNVIGVGVSIGVAIYPKDGEGSSDLIANADLAMYRAKESGSDLACFFAPEMDEQVRQRRSLAQDLRSAIEKNELELYYQAQTSLETSQVVGYEVLLRWHHPVHGTVPPCDFIPIAEESGLIIAIGNWVLETACRDAAAWPEPYRVAVNVSGVQFNQGDLPTFVHGVLLRTGLSAERLELEITESVLISDMSRTLAILRRIKALGVTIAMDDFGTGYSSLSTLQAFPFDKIKIDRSFVEKLASQPQARSIVRAILALGRSLEIPVLAEGIETAEHLDFLRNAGCDEAQGYLLGKPKPQGFIAELSSAKSPAANARMAAG